MLNLFDSYHQSSWDLHFSLLKSGYTHPTVVINDDGFLPDDVTSPYLFFTGFDKAKGRPLYFNEIEVPDFWEIASNNNQGEIYDYHQRRGLIHYAAPSHLRQVKSVDWFDLKGCLRITDRYNKYGHRHAQTIYNANGQATHTSYFTFEGREVLVENHVTGDILLEHLGKTHLFKNKSELIIYYLKVAGFNLDRIFYNSLSTPFLVAYRLGQAGEDVLFWQEGLGDSIPGNMTLLLKKSGLRATKIVVQNRDVYQRMLRLVSDEEKNALAFLGFQYPFKREPIAGNKAFVMTNSDNIEQLSLLVQELPQCHFHIGALTEMSQRLMDFAKCDNVTLYPNISQTRIQQLFKESTFYLDINHGNEVALSIRRAFENRLPIFAFHQTVHNRHYVAHQHIFQADQALDMVTTLRGLLQSPERLAEAVQRQELAAEVESMANYRTVLG